MDVTPKLNLRRSYNDYCLVLLCAILVDVCYQGLLYVCTTTDRIDVSHDAKLVGVCNTRPVHHLFQDRYAVPESN